MNPTKRSGNLADASVSPKTETLISPVREKIPRCRKLEITSTASIPKSKIPRMDLSDKSPVNRRKAFRTSRKTIPQLPQEVLVEIMKWLTVDERKNAKSLCRDWFFASTAYDKREKFCFGTEDCQRNLDEILLTLSKSTRQFFCLEFYGARFGGIPRIEFWRACGSEITSLKLIDCIISSSCFAGLLKYCCNLRTLEFYFDDLNDMKKGLEIQVPSKIIPSELKNSSLQTLKIHFRNHSCIFSTFWVSLLRAMFNMFPNIEDFSFCHYDLHGGSDPCTTPRPIEVFDDPFISERSHSLTCTSLFKRLSHFPVKNISLNFMFHQEFYYDALVLVDRLTQITEISVDWDFQEFVDEKIFLKFAQKQVNLKKITNVTKDKMVDERTLNSFLTAVLKIPSLREIQIFFYNVAIQWEDSWSSLLSKSNVEILRIVCSELMFSETLLANAYRPNEKLKIFAVRASTSFNSSILPLLKTFPDLKDLFLSHVNDDVLKSVCENQIELRTLTIEDIVDSNSLNNQNCLNRLKNLRKLEIPETIMLKNCNLSALKNLRVNHKFFKDHDQSDLQIYQSLSSSLDALWIEHIRFQNPVLDKNNWNPTSYTSWEKQSVLFFIDHVTELVRSLPNLKFLYIGNVIIQDSHMTKVKESDVSPIFSLCPLLRVFGSNGNMFAKDVIANRIYNTSNISKRELIQRFMNVNEEVDFHYRDLHLYGP